MNEMYQNLLDAILDNPYDVSHRMVFADYLIESEINPIRGEWIQESIQDWKNGKTDKAMDIFFREIEDPYEGLLGIKWQPDWTPKNLDLDNSDTSEYICDEDGTPDYELFYGNKKRRTLCRGFCEELGKTYIRDKGRNLSYIIRDGLIGYVEGRQADFVRHAKELFCEHPVYFVFLNDRVPLTWCADKEFGFHPKGWMQHISGRYRNSEVRKDLFSLLDGYIKKFKTEGGTENPEVVLYKNDDDAKEALSRAAVAYGIDLRRKERNKANKVKQ